MLKLHALIGILLAFTCRSYSRPLVIKNYNRSFETYQDYSQHLSQLISRAGGAVWIASSKLNDGDITNSLFLSQYRQVQVAVLLASNSIKHFSSQFPWLQAHQIPVRLTKQNLFRTWPTFIIIDGSLLLASVSLDPSVRKGKFLIRSGGADYQANSFIRLFKSQFLRNVRQNTPSMGLNLHNPRGVKVFKAKDPSQWNGFKPYHYGNRRTGAPADVARRLPKKTKYQELGKLQRKD
ncbi:MAG: hypothetical protein AB8G05_13245 [Oligoflexales bacterium]